MAGLVAKAISELSERQLARVQATYEEAFDPGLRVPFAELTALGSVDQRYVAMEDAQPVGIAALRLRLMAGGPEAFAPLQGNLLPQPVLAIYTDRYGLSPADPLVSRALASFARNPATVGDEPSH
jgi:hypothetical protein